MFVDIGILLSVVNYVEIRRQGKVFVDIMISYYRLLYGELSSLSSSVSADSHTVHTSSMMKHSLNITKFQSHNVRNLMRIVTRAGLSCLS